MMSTGNEGANPGGACPPPLGPAWASRGPEPAAAAAAVTVTVAAAAAIDEEFLAQAHECGP